MADPKSWVLVQAMKTRLETISVANGYQTNAGAHVTDEPTQKDEAVADYYLAVMWEGAQRSGAASRSPSKARRPTVAVVVMVGADRASAQHTLHLLLEDVDRVFLPEQAAMQAFAEGIAFPKFVSSEAIPPSKGMKWIGAIVRFETDYLI